jgi:hypothetical protein
MEHLFAMSEEEYRKLPRLERQEIDSKRRHCCRQIAYEIREQEGAEGSGQNRETTEHLWSDPRIHLSPGRKSNFHVRLECSMVGKVAAELLFGIMNCLMPPAVLKARGL